MRLGEVWIVGQRALQVGDGALVPEAVPDVPDDLCPRQVGFGLIGVDRECLLDLEKGLLFVRRFGSIVEKTLCVDAGQGGPRQSEVGVQGNGTFELLDRARRGVRPSR